MSFHDFFGISRGGSQPKSDARHEEPSSGPKGRPPTSGSGVQPPEVVVGSVAFGPPGVTAGKLDVGALASYRGQVGERPLPLSADELAAQHDAFEKRRAEREAEMKRQVREVLVERAALAMLQGCFANPESTDTPTQLWAAAERFVDAREAGAALYREGLKGADQ